MMLIRTWRQSRADYLMNFNEFYFYRAAFSYRSFLRDNICWAAKIPSITILAEPSHAHASERRASHFV